MTKEQFETALAEGNIVEHTCHCENYYGTSFLKVERHMEQQIPVILVIEVRVPATSGGCTPVPPPFCHAAGYERAGTPPALPWDRSGGSHSEAPAPCRTEIARSDYDEHVVNDVVYTCAEEIYSIIQKRIAEPDAE